MRLKAAVFDLDGTLVDSLGDIVAAMNFALERHGLPTHDAPAYRGFIGEGVEHLVRQAVPSGSAELHGAVLSTYRARYREHLLDRTRPYPGIREVLGGLARAGVRLAVLSNKLDAPTKELVGALFPEVPWRAVYGERSGVPRKPDPTAARAIAAELDVAPGACAFIGDTPVDMATARNAGMWAVGVAWGYREAALLRSHGAQAVAGTAEELLAALQEGPPL